MNGKYKKVKKILWLFDVCCVFAGIVFLFQIAMQEAELEGLKIILELEEENKDLQKEKSELLADIKDYFKEAEEIREKICDAKEEYAKLEKNYNLRHYIDTTAAELDKENGGTDYIERYFRVEKKELQAIINKSDIGGELEPDFTVGEEFGLLLPIGEQIWLRYDDTNNLPIGLLVQNPASDISYKDVRIGMKLDFDILGKRETVQLGFGQVRYALYEDDKFYYYYVEIEEFPRGTILYITQK